MQGLFLYISPIAGFIKAAVCTVSVGVNHTCLAFLLSAFNVKKNTSSGSLLQVEVQDAAITNNPGHKTAYQRMQI